jgi:hypothetical protein
LTAVPLDIGVYAAVIRKFEGYTLLYLSLQEYFQGIGGVIGSLLAITGKLRAGIVLLVLAVALTLGISYCHAWHFSTTPGPSAFFV